MTKKDIIQAMDACKNHPEILQDLVEGVRIFQEYGLIPYSTAESIGNHFEKLMVENGSYTELSAH